MTVQIKAGERVMVDFAGRIEEARILSVHEQHGARIVRFRIGIPIIGTTTTETIENFWKRIVKA